jgi:hypothetical protein
VAASVAPLGAAVAASSSSSSSSSGLRGGAGVAVAASNGGGDGDFEGSAAEHVVEIVAVSFILFPVGRRGTIFFDCMRLNL